MTTPAKLANWRPWLSSTAPRAVRWDMHTVIQEVHQAFAPWGCIIHVDGFEKRLHCQIVDHNGKPVIEQFILSSRDLEPETLRGTIQRIRRTLNRNGFVVEPCSEITQADSAG